MKKRFLLSFMLFIVTLLLISPLYAKDYYFNVDKNYSNVYINKDGSVDIEYFLTFTPKSGSKAIDIVDIGLPNDQYNLDTATADIDNIKLTSIKDSSYIAIGVEVPLNGYEIQPEITKTLHFKINNQKMIFQDDNDKNFASVEFFPTYYESKFTTGKTDLKVSFYLPIGTRKDQIITRHNPDVCFDTAPDGRLIVSWNKKDASPSSQYKYGLSFPVGYVDKAYPAGDYKSADKYYSYDNDKSSSTSSDIESCLFPLIFFIGFIFIIGIGYYNRRIAKNKYLPPEGKIEGFGSNTNLKEAEIAIIKQLPLARVCSIIIAELLQKGVIENITKDKLIDKINTDDLKDKNLTTFEKEFIDCLLYKDSEKFEAKLKSFFTNFINDTVNQMNDFSRDETNAYYYNIVLDLWTDIESNINAGDLISLRKITNILENKLPLLMTDINFPEKIKPVFANKNIPKPRWIAKLRKAKNILQNELSKEHSDNDKDDRYDDNYVEDYIEIFDNFDFHNYVSFNNICMDVVEKTNPSAISSNSYGSSGASSCACACACACAGGGR